MTNEIPKELEQKVQENSNELLKGIRSAIHTLNLGLLVLAGGAMIAFYSESAKTNKKLEGIQNTLYVIRDSLESYQPKHKTQSTEQSYSNPQNPSQVMAEDVRNILSSGHPLPNLYDNPDFQKEVNPQIYQGEKK